jgi:hypothetical protein
MASVDKKFADNLASNAGYYNGGDENELGDNPRCVLIIEYDNAFGGKGYGLVMETDSYNKYTESEFVQNPKVYWEYKA